MVSFNKLFLVKSSLMRFNKVKINLKRMNQLNMDNIIKIVIFILWMDYSDMI
jgi:hypothetical protein